MENNSSETNSNVSIETNLAAVNLTNIANNINFNNGPVQEEITKERKRRRVEDLERKQLEEEKYQQTLLEQQYKRLMHLLNRSKFYSSFIVNKINKNLEKDTSNSVRRENSKKITLKNENIPPQGKTKTISNDMKNYISKDVQKKIQLNKDKLNLNVEDADDKQNKDPQLGSKASDNLAIQTLKYFNGDLRDYQIQGLQWLTVLYENGLNGILADEMGLGKTIQVIALLCHLIEKCQDGPYLLIAPLSTIPNWAIEFEKFAPMLPVIEFYGHIEERKILKKKIKQKYNITKTYNTLPIVLTTFEVPLFESKFIQSFNWRYIIIDEGHRIKNHKCQLIKILKCCKSMNRLLLTGTPLQNNLAELWSLLNFLLPEIFDDLAVFESWFNSKEFDGDDRTKKFLKLEEEKNILTTLREILQPFMLRREKSDVCLDIPPKKELLVYAPLTELQHDLYKAFLNYDLSKLTMREENPIIYTKNGTRPKRQCVLRNMNNNANMYCEKEMSPSTLLQKNNESTDSDILENKLSSEQDWSQNIDVSEHNRQYFVNAKFQNRYALYKKVVNHPYLIHHPLGTNCLPLIDQNFINASGKLLVLDAMLAKLKEQGHKVLLFSTWVAILDMIEDYLSLRTYKYLRLDGQTKLEVRKENIKVFNTDPEIFLFLISTRAGGVGLNLVGADTVIMYDSDWNPQADIQAMARCHRIGQKVPVVVYKLCTKGTIDEAIVKRAEAKRLLEKVVISRQTSIMNLRNSATVIELQKLLESPDCQVVTSKNEVFTEEELNKLLDRSDLYASQQIS